MKKTLLFITAFLTMVAVNAQAVGDTFTVDGINYTVTSAFPDDDNVEVSGMDTTTANISFPATVVETISGSGYTMNVTGVGLEAFKADATIETVVLPASITTLKQKAFEACPNLTTINLENIVTFDGNSQFASCSSLTEVDLSNAETLPGYQFYWCSSLTTVNNFNSAVTIGNGVFRRSGITQLNIPATVTSIANQLFRQCESLVQFKVNWTSFSDFTIDEANMFANITAADVKMYVPVGLESVYEAADSPFAFDASDIVLIPAENIIEGDMPELTVGEIFTVAGINYQVTSNDPDLASVSGVDTPMAAITVPLTATDPNNSRVYDVTSIGGSAFLNDTTLESVSLPTSVTALSSDAFSGCVNLETINLENIVTIATQNAFYNCLKLTTIDLPAATSIGNFAFFPGTEPSLVSSINIPNAVTIGNSSFRATVIPSVNIPASVTTITTRAFMDCASLASVQVNWSAAADIPVIVATVFENLTIPSINLYVPVGTTADYAAAPVWQDFNIIEGNAPTLGSDDFESALGVSLYPNPTNGIVNIKNNNNADAEVTVFDINGRALLQSTDSRIDISDLAAGLYVFSVKTDKGQLVKRILKK